jgi:hypothetical protein
LERRSRREQIGGEGIRREAELPEGGEERRGRGRLATHIGEAAAGCCAGRRRRWCE